MWSKGEHWHSVPWRIQEAPGWQTQGQELCLLCVGREGHKDCFSFSGPVFTTLSTFPCAFRIASPCTGVCHGLCPLHGSAEPSSFQCQSFGFSLPALGEGGHHTEMRSQWSTGIFLVLLFRYVSLWKVHLAHRCLRICSCEGFPRLRVLRGLRCGVVVVHN